MKQILFFLAIIAVILGLKGICVASSEDGYAHSNDSGSKYLGIFGDYITAKKPTGEQDYFSKVRELTIDRYIAFIKQYPDSSFVPEAKLRIAEFYDVIRQREKAKAWLDDIIANHASDDYYGIKVYRDVDTEGRVFYSAVELYFTGEKTAAWALYYRASWFPENRTEDLQKIVKEYKDSKKIVDFAKELLNKK